MHRLDTSSAVTGFLEILGKKVRASRRGSGRQGLLPKEYSGVFLLAANLDLGLPAGGIEDVADERTTTVMLGNSRDLAR